MPGIELAKTQFTNSRRGISYVIIYLIVTLQGVAIGPLIKLLKVKREEPVEKTVHEKIALRVS
jgi:hypothetical protein